MNCIQKDFVRTDDAGRRWYRCILTATEEPENLFITGAAVDDLASDVRIAAGSVLILPGKEIIALEDENFSGEPRVGFKSITMDPELTLYRDGEPFKMSDVFPLYLDQTDDGYYELSVYSVEPLPEEVFFTFTPTPTWFIDAPDSGKGEAYTIAVAPDNDQIAFEMVATEEPGNSVAPSIFVDFVLSGSYIPPDDGGDNPK